jgi:hypothetical protein
MKHSLHHFVFAAAMALCVVSQSAKAVAVKQGSSPEIAFVGLYINDLYELDLKKSTYIADFYVWMRWSGEIDPSNMEFLNGSLDLKEHPYRVQTGNSKYFSYHCRGSFHALFDYHQYPLDVFCAPKMSQLKTIESRPGKGCDEEAFYRRADRGHSA